MKKFRSIIPIIASAFSLAFISIESNVKAEVVFGSGYAVQQTKPVASQNRETVDVSKFGAKCNDGSDATLAVIEALEYCNKTKAKKLIFPKGSYNFSPDLAFEKYYSITNNDGSLKRITFPIIGFNNFEIDGQGSEFIFTGFICPFIIDRSTNVTIKNFSIDWKRTFNSEGKVIAVRENEMDVTFSNKYPYSIENNKLIFKDENKNKLLVGSLLEYDPVKNETAFKVNDYYCGPNVKVEAKGNGVVTVFLKGIKAKPGNIMSFQADHRLCPAITLTDSKGITVNQVNIYHAGGMGVVAQRTKDILLDKVQVKPAPNSGRMVSLTADATHFSNCSGTVSMFNCVFTNQQDDATNIHGIYVRADRKLAPNKVLVKLVHAQQYGFDYIVKGQKLELVNNLSLVTYKVLTVKSVKRINSEYTNVEFLESLPAEFKTGDIFAAMEYPNVVIKNCTMGGNRARGILLGSRGKILVEGNTFHVPGAAILMEGDGRFWFEQSGVRNMEIKNNIFNNCNYGTWGNALIQVGAGIDKSFTGNSRYNRNIVIENNEIRSFDPRVLNIYSVDSLTYRNNKVNKSTDYPEQNANAAPFNVKSSSNVKTE